MSIRDSKPEDAAQYTEWLTAASDINLVDPGVYNYPTCNSVVVSDKAGEPALMNSFHLVLVMEALAPRPDLTPLQEARALKELFEAVKEVARKSGVREILFGCKDERVNKFIEGRGFTKVDIPVFRFKVPND
jgi:hypothetical protein